MFIRSNYTLALTSEDAFGVLRDLDRLSVKTNDYQDSLSLQRLAHTLERVMTDDDLTNYRIYCRDKDRRELQTLASVLNAGQER